MRQAKLYYYYYYYITATIITITTTIRNSCIQLSMRDGYANEAVDLVFFFFFLVGDAREPRSSASGARDRSLKTRDEVSTPAK